MKVAVVGCGAVGSYYGARLVQAGAEVHFLLRTDYEVVRERGLFVRSPEGDFSVRPICARVPEEIRRCDLVVIGLKTTANHRFADLLPALVGPSTILLTLQNGLGNEEQLARLFPSAQIMGGLCFVCLNRVEAGIIHHIAHGQVVIGEHASEPLPRTNSVAELLRKGNIPCAVAENLARTHWEKLIWNIPFNGLGVAGSAGYDAVCQGRLSGDLRVGACLPTNELLDAGKWEKLVRDLMREVIMAARGLGFDLSESLLDLQIERTKTMGPYRASTLIDFERGQPLELESLFLEPLRQARQAGVAVPRLEAMCRVLESLDARAES